MNTKWLNSEVMNIPSATNLESRREIFTLIAESRPDSTTSSFLLETKKKEEKVKRRKDERFIDNFFPSYLFPFLAVSIICSKFDCTSFLHFRVQPYQS